MIRITEACDRNSAGLPLSVWQGVAKPPAGLKLLEISPIVDSHKHEEMKPSFLFLLALAFASQRVVAVSIQTKAVPNGIAQDSYLGVISAAGGCTPYKWQMSSGALPTGLAMKMSSDTRSITLSGAPAKAGSYSFTMSVTGCGGGVAKASYKIVVQSKPDHVVDLSWNPSTSSDVAGYNIYRGPDGKSWSKLNVGLAASTTFSDSTVADSSTYYYAATAVDIKGNESNKSNIAKTQIP